MAYADSGSMILILSAFCEWLWPSFDSTSSIHLVLLLHVRSLEPRLHLACGKLPGANISSAWQRLQQALVPVAITPPGTGCACMFKEGYEEGLGQFASAVDSIDKEKNSENLIMSVMNIDHGSRVDRSSSLVEGIAHPNVPSARRTFPGSSLRSKFPRQTTCPCLIIGLGLRFGFPVFLRSPILNILTL